ncbi:MAG TPA: helix-turn-helix domain-containing protein [Pseudonocardiaceae bacterium]|nr:helix-turn-helix domain-containing protein [Pseudonocardiaceae bacterium]
MTKFDVSRAVRSSDLPKLARLLMFVLLDHADTDSAVIPEKFSPSLSELAAESGMGRNTVQEKLRDLESAGWVIRQRPPVEQSREGARTQYRLAVPVGAADTQPRSRTDLPLGRTPTPHGSHTDPGVGRTVTKPRSHSDPISNLSISANQSNQRARARTDPSRNGTPTKTGGDRRSTPDLDKIRAALADIGSKRLDDDWCRKVVKQATERATPRHDLTAMVVACIRSAPDDF